MKKLSVFLTLLFLTACEKSPNISQNLEGTWELEKYIANGTDSAQIINTVLGAKGVLTIDGIGGGFAYSYLGIRWGSDTNNCLNEQSSYETTSYPKITLQRGTNTNNTHLYIALADSGYTSFQVLDCESKTLWLSFQVHNRTYELHFTNLSK